MQPPSRAGWRFAQIARVPRKSPGALPDLFEEQ
jgi:hypothetical protein